MRGIVEYLLKIEKMARDFYKDSSMFFKRDEEFSRFLYSLFEEEATHFDAMLKAAEYFEGKTENIPAFISLDNAAKEAIELPFTESREKMTAGDLTKDAMIDCVITTEYSEWNIIFLYVVTKLKGISPEFGRLAAEVQRHKEHIEAFLESMPTGDKYLERVRRLPNVWLKKILVVEDDPANSVFLSVFLETEGMVETAKDGEEGLIKIGEQYFDIVVSDDSIPPMRGIEFYKQAAVKDNSIGQRFLFLTDYSSPENVAFLAEHNVRYMTKPADLAKLKMAVHDIIKGTRHH